MTSPLSVIHLFAGSMAMVVVASAATAHADGAKPLIEEPEFFRAWRTGEPARVWILGSGGLGGGTARLGPIGGDVGIEATVWAFDRVGFGVRVAMEGAGEPDGNGTDARYVAGFAAYRLAVWGTSKAARATTLFSSLGVGAGELNGYDYPRTQPNFDVTRAFFLPRVGVLSEWGPFAVGGATEAAVVPGQGFSLTLNLLFGVALWQEEPRPTMVRSPALR